MTEINEMATYFNKTFTEVGPKLPEKIPPTMNYSPKTKTIPISFYLHPTDNLEVESTIKNLKVNKSPGVDGIQSEALKHILIYIVELLTYIINKCFAAGIWPQIFKITCILPIFKNGDEKTATYYRPISLITTMSKVFEKILGERLNSYIR